MLKTKYQILKVQLKTIEQKKWNTEAWNTKKTGSNVSKRREINQIKILLQAI